MVWQQHTALATWVTPARKGVESWLRSERLCHEEKEWRRLAGLGFAISRRGLKVQGQSWSSPAACTGATRFSLGNAAALRKSSDCARRRPLHGNTYPDREHACTALRGAAHLTSAQL